MCRNLKRSVAASALLLAGLGAALPASAADTLKIGFMTTFSGPNAVQGTHLRDGFDLALDHAGGRIGGLPTEILYQDDQQKPDTGRQIADKFIEFNKVDVVVGPAFSNVMLAVHGPITRSKTIMTGISAGPSPIAGEQCSEYFFSTSWQGDSFAEAMGAHLQKKGVKSLYLMAPNFVSGKDVLAGLKRFYKGTIVGEVYTPLNQLDFAAELAQLRAAKPEAVFVFYPAGLGIQFVQQYAQAGLKEQFPLYSAYTIDNTTLPALGDAAVGVTTTTIWNMAMDNPSNRRFVTDFIKKYNYPPSEYSAQAYDAGRLLDGAVRKVNGRIEDRPGFIAALKEAPFQSVRGDFTFNTNHFPIQDFYLGTVAKGGDGKPAVKLGDAILTRHGDAYAFRCALK